jgi:hypothetical protein
MNTILPYYMNGFDIMTAQQEAGLEQYLKDIDAGCPFDFWKWYGRWCCEEGFFDDTNDRLKSETSPD